MHIITVKSMPDQFIVYAILCCINLAILLLKSCSPSPWTPGLGLWKPFKDLGAARRAGVTVSRQGAEGWNCLSTTQQ